MNRATEQKVTKNENQITQNELLTALQILPKTPH